MNTITGEITAADLPKYDPATIALPNGWSAEVRLESDIDQPAPWDNEDGHGPVSGWRPLNKRAGERELIRDRGRARYYDYAAAVRIAERDGWSCGVHPGGETCDFAKRQHRTEREVHACAVEQDFQRLRAWCRGDWEYVIVMVTVRDAEGEEVSSDVLGGVESDGEHWREVAAEMINAMISGVIAPNSAAETTAAAADGV